MEFSLMRYNRHAPIRFEGKTENPAFVAFLHTKSCIVRGCKLPSSVHHPYQRGRSGKWASDYWGLPACDPHHDEAEELGLEEFEKKYNLDVVLIIEHQIHEFCTRHLQATIEDTLVYLSTPVKTKTKPKAPAKPKNDLLKRFSALSDDDLRKAGIRTQSTIDRIREGKVGKAEERKLKRYLQSN